jgi:hypothetical protein
MCVHGKYILLFGGIFEITKELNDLHAFDIESNTWVTLYQECSSPTKSKDANNSSHIMKSEVPSPSKFTEPKNHNQFSLNPSPASKNKLKSPRK